MPQSDDCNQAQVLSQVGEEIRRAREAGNFDQAAEFARMGRELLAPKPIETNDHDHGRNRD
jgi:hypothetical protein